MMDTFSWSLFFNTGWGIASALLGLILTLLLFIGLVGAVIAKRDKDMGLGGAIIVFLLIVAVPFLLIFGTRTALRVYGRINTITVAQGDPTYVAVKFSNSGRAGTQYHSRVFDVGRNKVVGKVSRSGVFNRHKVLYSDGGIELRRYDDDEYVLADWRTKEKLVDINKALQARYKQPARIINKGNTLYVEHQDGRKHKLEWGTLLTKRPKARPLRDISDVDYCHIDPRSEKEPKLHDPKKLLRLREARRRRHLCTFSHLGKQVHAILHNTTAFGDSGDYLFSLTNEAGQPLWTTNIEPYMQGERFNLRDIQLRDGALSFWLVRDASLIFMQFDAQTGKIKQSTMLF